MTTSRAEARAALSARLGERALRHCVAVAETAAGLARVYGVDADEAYLAGLLHDWSREESPTELIDAAGDAGIPIHDVDRAVPYLLHAKVGALRVEEAFPGIPQTVLDAIERHTTATAEMTDLDMVVYVADMIEPGRTHPRVDELRGAVGELGLLELFAHAYEHSVSHLLTRRKHIHPATVVAWNAIVDRLSAGGDRP